MGWNDDEVGNAKKGMSTSSKVLIAIIACILLIILLLFMILLNIKETTFKIFVDGLATSNATKETLLTTVNGATYVNIEEFSKLVGYEYHKGEYKSSIIEEDKCYVEGKIETASFYLNDNKIYKLLVNEQDEQYEEYIVEATTQYINGKMYASLPAISKAFNVLISETSNQFQIYTLDYLINIYDVNVQNWGYESIKGQSFENKKALLYGCLVVKKNGGLYKIIDTNNTKEIVLDRYTAIEFSENTQEFFVTDSLQKVGVLNLDGTTKLEPAYDSIKVLDKENDLYIIKLFEKYGVLSGKGATVIYPEYESIGLTQSNMLDNKYLILDELIPICKEGKWGAYNKAGKLVLNVEFEQFGYSLTSIEVNGVKEVVVPVLVIERANGVVVKKGSKYGLLDVKGKELVPIAVDGIYAVNGAPDEDSRYFMLYKGEELNVVQRLIKAGLISEKIEIEENENSGNTIGNTANENSNTNTVENKNIINK